MTFEFKNPDSVQHTGFNGWLNTNTREVLFCSRLAHLSMIEKSQLEGVDGDLVYEMQSDGGPHGTGWLEIRQWCAQKGWVHFVTLDSADVLYYVCASTEQEKVCEAFARDADIRALFKGQSFYQGDDT